MALLLNLVKNMQLKGFSVTINSGYHKCNENLQYHKFSSHETIFIFIILLFYIVFRGPLKYIHKIYIITFCFFFCVFSSHIFCKILIAYVRTGSYLFKMLENKKGILDFVYSSRTLQTKLLPW